jgi:hypothetical protein
MVGRSLGQRTSFLTERNRLSLLTGPNRGHEEQYCSIQILGRILDAINH